MKLTDFTAPSIRCFMCRFTDSYRSIVVKNVRNAGIETAYYLAGDSGFSGKSNDL